MQEQLPEPEKIAQPTEPVQIQPHELVINPPTQLFKKSHHIKQFIMGIAGILAISIIGSIGYYLGLNNKNTPLPPVTEIEKVTPTIAIEPIPEASVSGTITTVAPIETETTSTLGDLMDTKTGKVTLKTDKTLYKKTHDVIYATVANGLLQPIYAQDEKTHCSILALQYLEGTEWKSIEDCFLGRLPATIATGSKRGRVIKLQTVPLPPLPPNDPNIFKPGLYRIAFNYSLSINGPQYGGELIRPLTIYSPPFTIEQ